MDITGAQQFEKKGGITLKRILACFVVLGVVVFALTGFSGMRREQAKEQCLVRFGNVNKALGLYRADFDGFSPCYNQLDLEVSNNKLVKYGSGSPLSCPDESALKPTEMRVLHKVGAPVSGSTPVSPEMFPIGTEENSVVAGCVNHVQYHFDIIHWADDGSRPPVSGNYIVLLRSGNAKSIPYSVKRENWVCRDAECVPEADRPSSWGAFSGFTLFEFEPKPPKFEY